MPLAVDASSGDLTTAFVFLFVMVAISFVAGYGVAYMRLSKRKHDE
jgi:hypothetical protein